MPRADSIRDQTAISPDRDRDIDLSAGKFDQTTADDLERAFVQFTESGKNLDSWKRRTEELRKSRWKWPLSWI
jgi:hypothetical protein